MTEPRHLTAVIPRPSAEEEPGVKGTPPAYDATLLPIMAQAPGGMSPAVQPISGVSSCKDRLGKRAMQYRKASMA